MELTYDNMVKFMEEYFPVYSEYGQDPGDGPPDERLLHARFRLHGICGVSGAAGLSRAPTAFLEFDVSHPSSYERLTPEDMTVDERRKIVFVIIKFEFIDTKDGPGTWWRNVG